MGNCLSVVQRLLDYNLEYLELVWGYGSIHSQDRVLSAYSSMQSWSLGICVPLPMVVGFTALSKVLSSMAGC